MSRSRSFAFPLPLPAARLGVLGLAALCCAGCASKQTSYDPPARVAGPAAPQGPGPWTVKVEIEDDGLPAQLAPRHRPPIQDDPAEPWSPNYGKQAPSRPARANVEPALQAPTLATAPTRRPAARQQVSVMDEDAIIRRAIAEHEMRRRD